MYLNKPESHYAKRKVYWDHLGTRQSRHIKVFQLFKDLKIYLTSNKPPHTIEEGNKYEDRSCHLSSFLSSLVITRFSAPLKFETIISFAENF